MIQGSVMRQVPLFDEGREPPFSLDKSMCPLQRRLEGVRFLCFVVHGTSEGS